MAHDFVNSTSQNVLLSIVTVTRNDAERLIKTIQSLVNFYGDIRYEHIIVDGCSTDNTSEMVNTYAPVPNLQFKSEPDDGIYDAMNRGAQRSRGQFLLFLNSGDRMMASPEKLAILLSDIDNTKTNIACFSFAHVDKNYYHIVKPTSVKEHKLPTSHQGMIFSSNFTRTYPYNTCYKIAADYDLYLHSQPSGIVHLSMSEPLTEVEINGVASSNPVTSYMEYLVIAFRNLHGKKRLICLIRIGLRAMVVIPLKLLFPQRWLGKLRKKE